MSLADRLATLRRRLARCTPRRLLAGLRDLVFALPGYRLTLLGRTAPRIAMTPPDPWPGNAERGNAIAAAEFTFGTETVCGDAALWEAAGSNARRGGGPGAGPGPAWLEAFHGFGWLTDLHMIGNDAARRRARMLVADWITHNAACRAPAWRGDVLGRRLAAWFGQYDFFCASADDAFRARVLAAMTQQARHLSRALPRGLAGARLLAAIKGLIYAGLCLPGREAWLERGLRLITRELPRQVLGDGGHIERSPSAQLAVLRDLVDIRAALIAGQREVPAALQGAIDRMAPTLRFFRHGDGGLALFNDSREEESWLVDMVLTRANARGKPLASAPHTGFQRLAAGRTLVIADTGAPVAVEAPPGTEERAHAGTLAFEMSVGKERLIVNCGAFAGSDPDWRRAGRATAAHSTLVVGDTNSSEILADGSLGHHAGDVVCRRNEADGNIWVEASHDGYLRPFGLIHRRRLYLGAGGDDFRGEDSLIAPPAGLGVPLGAARKAVAGRRARAEGGRFALRFHLHPRVQASLLQDGAAALLRVPRGGGWRLRASGGVMTLEESVYLGAGDGEAKRSEQLVIRGPIRQARGDEPAARVKWAITRVGDKG